MTAYNDLSIEELIAVVESLPRGAAVNAGDLADALRNLRLVRIQERLDGDDLFHAIQTGDMARLERRQS